MPDQGQLHCRIDPDLLQWVRDCARSQGRQISEIVEDVLTEYRSKTDATPESKALRLERDFNRVDKELSELEDEENKKYVRWRKIAFALVNAYPEFEQDFKRIRFRALDDLERNHASWIKDLEVKDKIRDLRSTDITESCRFAGRLVELRKAHKDLENQLRASCGMSEARTPTGPESSEIQES